MRKTLIAQRSLFDQSIDTLVALLKPDAKLQKMDQVKPMPERKPRSGLPC